jgi:undecaprenyl-diphosphatase
MTEFVDFVLRVVGEHRAWAYALAYLLAMAEALPLVGTVVPGSIVVVGLGALVPSGTLDLWYLLVWSTLGAITGDGASYGLGRHFHEEIARVWPFRRYPTLISRGESLFRAHGGKAVFASRFVQGPRAFVPLAAGIVGMPVHRFLFVNILSALIWAPSHILVGALLGGSVVLAGAIAGRLAVLLVIVLVLACLGAWLVRLGLRLVPRVWTSARERASAWAHAGNGWGRRQVAALLDPDRPETTALVIFSFVLVGAMWIFFGVLEDVITGDPLVRVDTAVHNFLQGLRTPWIDRLAIGITELGDKTVVIALAVSVLLWLAVRRAWRTAGYWVSGLVLASGFGTLLKLTLHRPRPTAVYEGWSAYAFPSGHATMSMVLWGFLCVLIAREARPRWWPWIFGAGATIVALIAFSRLYLGVHWFSDVVGGLAFGTAWVALLSVAYLRHTPQRVGAMALATVACGAFLVAGIAHIHAKFPDDLRRYAVKASPDMIPFEAWRDARWRDLPARRADMEGEYEEPLTIQWAGDLPRLKDTLLANGWRTPTPWSVPAALDWLNPASTGESLPVLPKFDDGRLPSLTLVKVGDRLPAGASRLVLRLWDSEVRLTAGSGPPRVLWIGEAVGETVSRPLGLFSIARTMRDVDAPVAVFRRSLEPNSLVIRSRETITPGWDGRVILGGGDTALHRQR